MKGVVVANRFDARMPLQMPLALALKLTVLGFLLSGMCTSAQSQATPESKYKKAQISLSSNRFSDAERELLALKAELVASNSNVLLESVLNSLISVYYKQGSNQQAVPVFRELIALKEKLYGSNDASLAKTRLSFAALLRQGGAEAEAQKEEQKASKSSSQASTGSQDKLQFPRSDSPLLASLVRLWSYTDDIHNRSTMGFGQGPVERPAGKNIEVSIAVDSHYKEVQDALSLLGPKDIQFLSWTESYVDDNQLQFIKKFPDIRILHLDNDKWITDASSATFLSMPKLKELSLTGTRFTAAGVAALKKAGITVNFSARDIVMTPHSEAMKAKEPR